MPARSRSRTEPNWEPHRARRLLLSAVSLKWLEGNRKGMFSKNPSPKQMTYAHESRSKTGFPDRPLDITALGKGGLPHQRRVVRLKKISPLANTTPALRATPPPLRGESFV